MNINNNEDFQDRKSLRRDSFKQKKSTQNFTDKLESRDKAKIKKALKSKMEKIKEEEIWEDWENEIH
jgi:hypothetical protein